MFDEESDRPSTTLIAGLILLIVLAAVAVMSGEPSAADRAQAVRKGAAGPAEVAGPVDGGGAMPGILLARALRVDWSRQANPRRLSPGARSTPIDELLRSVRPISEPLSRCFGEDALVAYDLGIAPAPAAEALAELLEASAPEIRAWLRRALGEFAASSGLEPETDFLPYLGDGVAVGLLPPEAGIDGWPLPRKAVILRVLDDDAVARYLREWFSWEAGALAPMTHGVLGASVDAETVNGFDLVGLRLNGLLPARLPLPSPSYVVADGILIVSPVRSAVAETLGRLLLGCALPPPGYSGGSAVEEVWLNFPEWPEAWRRAEPVVERVAAWLGAESPAAIEACRSVIGFLAGFEPAHGTTSLTPDGGFAFRIEMKPAER